MLHFSATVQIVLRIGRYQKVMSWQSSFPPQIGGKMEICVDGKGHVFDVIDITSGTQHTGSDTLRLEYPDKHLDRCKEMIAALEAEDWQPA